MSRRCGAGEKGAMKLQARAIVLGVVIILGGLTTAVVVMRSPARRADHPLPGGPQFAVQPALVRTPGNSPAPGASRPGTADTSPTPGPHPPVAPSKPASGTLHFVANVGEQIGAVQALGFNLIDTGPDPTTINALPSGVRALVWLGTLDNHDCGHPGYTYTAFTDAVDRLVADPKVFGYFLADEPHPKDCPAAAADLRQRADYIHAHDPTHRSFVVVLDGSNQCGGTYGCEFAALAPAKTHVDLIGLDPYPCNTGNAGAGCTYQKIDDTVHHAEQNGVPAEAIVPVFQTFGQACTGSAYYRLPSTAELRTMLSHWAALVRHPVFDYAYGWEHQDSACPTLSDANGLNGYPDLQAVVAQHNLP